MRKRKLDFSHVDCDLKELKLIATSYDIEIKIVHTSEIFEQYDLAFLRGSEKCNRGFSHVKENDPLFESLESIVLKAHDFLEKQKMINDLFKINLN